MNTEQTRSAPLIDYAARGRSAFEGRDELYEVPIFRHESISTLDWSRTEQARHITASPGELPLDILYIPRASRRLLVGLHGAESRAQTSLPKFQFVRSFLTRSESLLFLSDSSLLQHENLGISWMVGTPSSHLVPRYAELIADLMSAHNYDEVVLVGHSAGGFAAIAVGALLENSRAISVNGQTVVPQYEPWTVSRLRECVFNECSSVAEMAAKYPNRLDLRKIISNRPNSSSFSYYAHADDPNTMDNHPMFPLLAEHLGLDPERGGVTLHGDALTVCHWQYTGSPHACPGSVLPFVEDTLGETPRFNIAAEISANWQRSVS